MFNKYSIFMMLLIVTASLVGISSIYKPANVETQPQLQKPIPGTKGLVTQQRAETLAQAMADKQLLDRLFPQIIKRIDGNTLLQKINAKTLAAKVLPYLDISASVVRRDGTEGILDATDITRDLGLTSALLRSSTAKCNDGETAVGGGFLVQSVDPAETYLFSAGSQPDLNGWSTNAQFGDKGKIQASVVCLTLNVGLKDAQQPQQQPSPPPGGPPLQSPSGPVVR
jgi:hypothetical protein